jgi:hypothetical protein
MVKRMRDAGRRAVRQTASWHALRPGDDELRELAELVLDVTAGHDGRLASLVRELAPCCRHASVATAIDGMISAHTRRAHIGDSMLPPLRSKALAFHRCFAERAAWEWLNCR